MDSFFLSKGGGSKRKTAKPAFKKSFSKKISEGSSGKSKQNKEKETTLLEEEGESDSSENNNLTGAAIDSEEEDEFLKETPAQKRLRLAKSYLEKVHEDVEDDIMIGEIDAKEIDRELIAERLAKETNVERAFNQIAEKFSIIETSKSRSFASRRNGHQLSLTCLAFCAPTPSSKNTNSAASASTATSPPPLYIYSASKDAVIVKWDFWNGEKVHVVSGNLKPTKRLARQIGKKNLAKKEDGHCDEIWCMDASSDGAFVVTGGLDKAIHIWSVETNELVGHLIQHRDAVSGLKFRKGHNQLYSSSYDRTVKVWNVDEQSYVETLFGHQDKITCIDALSKERCLTSGSRDRTCRLWKIVEESQLVFRGGGGGLAITEDLVVLETMGETAKKRAKDNGASGGSIDQLAMLDEEYFVSGSDSGAISLWSINKKKPIFTKLKCHGPGACIIVNGQESKQSLDHMTGSDDPSNDTVCNWITALAAVRYSDMFVSGSADGYLRLWKVSNSKKSFNLVNCIALDGFINCIALFQAPSLDFYKNSIDTPSTTENVDQTGLSAVAKRILIANERAKSKALKSKQELYVAAAVGSEHRLGRWWRLKGIKNHVFVLSLGSAQ